MFGAHWWPLGERTAPSTVGAGLWEVLNTDWGGCSPSRTQELSGLQGLPGPLLVHIGKGMARGQFPVRCFPKHRVPSGTASNQQSTGKKARGNVCETGRVGTWPALQWTG